MTSQEHMRIQLNNHSDAQCDKKFEAEAAMKSQEHMRIQAKNHSDAQCDKKFKYDDADTVKGHSRGLETVEGHPRGPNDTENEGHLGRAEAKKTFRSSV